MSSKVQNLLALAIVIVGLVLIWVGVVGTLQKLQPKRATLATYQREIVLINQLLTKEKQVFEKFAQIQTRAQKIFQAIPRNLALSEILETIRGLANASGLVVERIKITPNSSEPTSKEAKETATRTNQAVIELGAKGNYEGLRLLTRAIETNLPLLDIDRVRIQGGSAQSQQLQFDFRLITYYLE